MNRIIYTIIFTFSLLAIATTSATAQNTSGPIQITEINGTDTLVAGSVLRDISLGDVISVQGAYGNIGNAQLLRMSYDVYKGDWSGLDYQTIDTIASAAAGVGTLDGTINYDFTIPMDAAVFGTIEPTPAAYLVQVRVEYVPAEDTFWNLFVEVNDGTTSTTQLPINGLNIFPNPVGNLMVINTAENQEKQVQIMDVTGKVLKSLTMAGNGDVDMSDLQAGFYVVKVKEGDRLATQKIVVN